MIAFGPAPEAIGIYLHWNGGEESVEAFLDATRGLMKSRGPDGQYGPARLVQVIGNYLGGTTSPSQRARWFTLEQLTGERHDPIRVYRPLRAAPD